MMVLGCDWSDMDSAKLGENTLVLIEHRIERHRLRPAQSGRLERPPSMTVAEHLDHRRPERIVVREPAELTLTEHFPATRIGRRDHSRAARHRLQIRQPEPFIGTR